MSDSISEQVHYRIVFLSFIAILIDRTVKLVVSSAQLSTLVLNYGWIGGTLAHSHFIIRIGILAGYYSAFCVLLVSFWKKIALSSLRTQLGVFLFFAGITSNLIDRIARGYVIDFIPISWDNWKFTFNVADVFQCVGVLLFLGSDWWRKGDRRIKIFVDQRLQLRLFFKISLIFVGFSMAVIALIFVLLRQDLHDSSLLSSLVFVIGTYGFLFEAILFSVLLAETQRWLGPFHAFIAFVKMMDRKPSPEGFKLRSSDEFKELENIAKKLNF